MWDLDGPEQAVWVSPNGARGYERDRAWSKGCVTWTPHIPSFKTCASQAKDVCEGHGLEQEL